MNDLNLARRAVACRGWRQVFTTTITARHVGVVRDHASGVLWRLVPGSDPDEWLPDFNDAATRGSLLERLRGLYRDPSLSTRCRSTLRTPGVAESGMTLGPWDIVSTSEHVTIGLHGTLAPTEEAALVAALENAP